MKKEVSKHDLMDYGFHDQAATLRADLIRSRESRTTAANGLMERAMARAICVTSGKGGVGKTNLVVNLAVSLGNRGKSVLVLDADLSLANVDVMLGLRPRATLHEVITGRMKLDEILVRGPGGISVIPASSGIERLTRLTDLERMTLLEEIERIALQYDYLLIDTQAGISADVMQFNAASHECLCVINPEPTSLTDAYALIKVLAKSYGEREVSIICTRVSSRHDGEQLFEKLRRTVERFLQIDLKYRGCVPSDSLVLESVRQQKAVVDLFPSSPSALAYAALAREIEGDHSARRVKGGMQFFFKQLLECNGA